MSNIKRVAIVLAVVVLVFVVGYSFKGSDILDRAIILGLGIDGTDDGGITLTAEVVSPGNGTEQVGTFSKTVTVQGRAIAEAIQNVAEYTGKEASLGQCVVLVFGQDFYENVDFSATIEYFINHHSLKESAIICCCEGSAQDLFNNSDALSQSVSLSIATLMLDQAKKIGINSINLLKYARSQSELHCTGFLNKIKFVPSENKDSNDPDKTQGFFSYREYAVFRKNKYVCDIDEQHARGMSLFLDNTVGDMFIAEMDGLTRTLQVSNKSIDQKLTDEGVVEIKIKLSVRLGRTDSEEVSGAISAQKKKEITPEVLDEVKKQAQALAQQYLAQQAEFDFDLLKLHEAFRQKDGNSKELAEMPTANFVVKLTVEVEEG
ncbi:MAG: hypothetical protein J1G02_01555 [Clostridiales bacterium]|nr:hypothetical protein [Clostridiales bacterium]